MLISKADNPRSDKQVLSRKLDTARRLNTTTGWSLLGVAAVGVVEAQLSFEPEFRRVRPRALPPRLLELSGAGGRTPNGRGRSVELEPLVTPLPGGGRLGIVGTF